MRGKLLRWGGVMLLGLISVGCRTEALKKVTVVPPDQSKQVIDHSGSNSRADLGNGRVKKANRPLTPYSLRPGEDPDATLEAVINAALDTGGTYTKVDFNGRDGNWGAMLEGLPQASDWQAASELSLVTDVKFYARIAAGGAAADYLYVAVASRPMMVTVDTQGHFAPALAVNGGGTMVNETGSEFSLSFSAVKGETYRIALNAPEGSAGLYSIVLRQAEDPARS